MHERESARIYAFSTLSGVARSRDRAAIRMATLRKDSSRTHTDICFRATNSTFTTDMAIYRVPLTMVAGSTFFSVFCCVVWFAF